MELLRICLKALSHLLCMMGSGTIFLTSACLVRAIYDTEQVYNDLKIEVHHEGNEVLKGYLAKYDLDKNFAVVYTMESLDVHVALAVAFRRGESGELMEKSVIVAGFGYPSRSEDDKELMLSSLEISKNRILGRAGKMDIFEPNFNPDGGRRHFACTGFFIEWTKGYGKIILTSASLVRESDDGCKIAKNLAIQVLLPNGTCDEGYLQHYSLHYNVALVSTRHSWNAPPVCTRLSQYNCSWVAAIGPFSYSGVGRYPAFLEYDEVGLDDRLNVGGKDTIVGLDNLEAPVQGAKLSEQEGESWGKRLAAEDAAGHRDEARDLGARQAEVAELGDAGGQRLVHPGADEARVVDDHGGDVRAGEAEAGEEGEDGVGVGGGPEVGELPGDLLGLGSPNCSMNPVGGYHSVRTFQFTVFRVQKYPPIEFANITKIVSDVRTPLDHLNMKILLEIDVIGICSIAASVMCVEAQHRLAFETIHGIGSFPLKAKRLKAVKKKCMNTKVWSPADGAMVEDVLKVLAKGRGVETTQGIFLPINGYHMYKNVQKDISHEAAVYLLLIHGPLVATLWVNDEYMICTAENDLVYSGSSDRDKDPNHKVVCFAYRFVGKELHLRVLDNHTEDGPVRWVLYECIDEIHLLTLKEPVPKELINRYRKKGQAESFLSNSINKAKALLIRRLMTKCSESASSQGPISCGRQSWEK
uniref:Uncharacterized protein n=1 Tax=Oryza punctata TaxID=4537 RepID=A0A0E0KLE8_ORYPU